MNPLWLLAGLAVAATVASLALLLADGDAQMRRAIAAALPDHRNESWGDSVSTSDDKLAELFATVFGPDTAPERIIEFAFSEATRGRVDCAHVALLSVPPAHLSRVISGSALLSQLAVNILTGNQPAPATPPIERPAPPRS